VCTGRGAVSIVCIYVAEGIVLLAVSPISYRGVITEAKRLDGQITEIKIEREIGRERERERGCFNTTESQSSTTE